MAGSRCWGSCRCRVCRCRPTRVLRAQLRWQPAAQAVHFGWKQGDSDPPRWSAGAKAAIMGRMGVSGRCEKSLRPHTSPAKLRTWKGSGIHSGFIKSVVWAAGKQINALQMAAPTPRHPGSPGPASPEGTRQDRAQPASLGEKLPAGERSPFPTLPRSPASAEAKSGLSHLPAGRDAPASIPAASASLPGNIFLSQRLHPFPHPLPPTHRNLHPHSQSGAEQPPSRGADRLQLFARGRRLRF